MRTVYLDPLGLIEDARAAGIEVPRVLTVHLPSFAAVNPTFYLKVDSSWRWAASRTYDQPFYWPGVYLAVSSYGGAINVVTPRGGVVLSLIGRRCLPVLYRGLRTLGERSVSYDAMRELIYLAADGYGWQEIAGARCLR